MRFRQGVDQKRKAVFLDRDGTLNVNYGYVHQQQDWVWINGAIEALKSLYDAGFSLVIVTNQAGIARGYYQHSNVETLHEWMKNELLAEGIELSGIYFCPHHPEFGEIKQCACRKPQSGMLVDAARDLQLDLENSWIIGDQMTDALAGLNLGTKAIVIGSQSMQDMLQIVPRDFCLFENMIRNLTVVPTITAAVDFILMHV